MQATSKEKKITKKKSVTESLYWRVDEYNDKEIIGNKKDLEEEFANGNLEQGNIVYEAKAVKKFKVVNSALSLKEIN